MFVGTRASNVSDSKERRRKINTRNVLVSFNESYSGFQMQHTVELMLFIMSVVIFASVYLKKISLFLHFCHIKPRISKGFNQIVLHNVRLHIADAYICIIKCIDEQGAVK